MIVWLVIVQMGVVQSTFGPLPSVAACRQLVPAIRYVSPRAADTDAPLLFCVETRRRPPLGMVWGQPA